MADACVRTKPAWRGISMQRTGFATKRAAERVGGATERVRKQPKLPNTEFAATTTS